MTFREVNPKLTFMTYDHPHVIRQRHWNDSEHSSIATFAGSEMMICINDDLSYQLTYLNMAHPKNFKSLDSAKNAASDFAKSVLVHMLKMLGLSPEDKNDPLLMHL